MYDAVVIGAGPAGSQAAFGLSRLGYRVVVLEQKDSLAAPVCCTGIISRECVDSFAIDRSVILRWLNSATVFAPSGEHLTIQRPEPQACVVDRSSLNVFLASRARAQGAEYRLGCLARGITVKGDRVRLEIAGQGSAIEARAAIIAVGSASRLVDGQLKAKIADTVTGAQVEVETTALDEVQVYLGRGIAPGFFAWLVPTLPGRALAGLMCRYRAGYNLRGFLAFLLAQGKIVSDDVTPGYKLMPLKPLPRTYAERLLVIGSAAGQVKPITGGGIYYGLLAADLAVNSLHRALTDGDLSARSLAVYQKDWKKKLDSEIKTGYRAHKFYQSLSDAQINRIFRIIKSGDIIPSLEQAEDLSFDWHGSVVLRLIGHQLLSKVLGAMKLSLPSVGGVKKSR